VLTQIIFSQKTDKERFTKIYELDYWKVNYNGETSGPSGAGGMRSTSAPYLEFLQNFVDSQNINTIIDIGCGDFQLMKHLRLSSHIKYIGVDIVDVLIQDNIAKYAKANIIFETVNRIEELEKYQGDLLLIKDVLQLYANNGLCYWSKFCY
jgi:SAM-dependent methyltransferase